MARAYAGTVMLEGTTVSEGRGTTRPLEVLFGAPDVDAKAVLAEMERLAPEWLAGCALRECWFEPTFHKHQKTLCNALMIHAEGPFYDHAAFRPWRLQALAFKAIRNLRSEEHTSELQSLMRISYAVFCLKKTKHSKYQHTNITQNQIMC